MTIHACDLCHSNDAIEVPHCREYMGGQAIHICSGCGFVYVRERRTPQEIADSWSNSLFGETFSSRMPHMKARHVLIAETLDVQLGLDGKRLCDIGAGEGQFLEVIRSYGAVPFGIEPSKQNCDEMAAAKIDHHHGTVESTPERLYGTFDIVTIMWTLENCRSCRDMIETAWKLLKPDGLLCVATGSRILVPFKKPLYNYLSKTPADTHAFRWSANTLRGILAECRFKTTFINSYIDSDVLLVIGQKTDRKSDWQRDDARAVADFFERWHQDTAKYFRARS